MEEDFGAQYTRANMHQFSRLKLSNPLYYAGNRRLEILSVKCLTHKVVGVYLC